MEFHNNSKGFNQLHSLSLLLTYYWGAHYTSMFNIFCISMYWYDCTRRNQLQHPQTQDIIITANTLTTLWFSLKQMHWSWKCVWSIYIYLIVTAIGHRAIFVYWSMTTCPGEVQNHYYINTHSVLLSMKAQISSTLAVYPWSTFLLLWTMLLFGHIVT